ncbi:hypothetical protein ACYSM9_15745 [Arthrobacter sp. C152]
MDTHLHVSVDGDSRPGVPSAKATTPEFELYGQVPGSDVQGHRRGQEISSGLEFVMSHHTDLLKRLEDV